MACPPAMKSTRTTSNVVSEVKNGPAQRLIDTDIQDVAWSFTGH